MKTPVQPHKYHNVFPIDAQMILMMAANTPITANDKLARVKAMDLASQRVKKMYSHLFRQEVKE